MNKFDDREKSFEKKFARDSELQFRIQARSNKYLAEFVSEKLGKSEDEKSQYVQEIIKADMEEAGSEDVFRKIKKDFKEIDLTWAQVKGKMKLYCNECISKSKKIT